LFFEHFFAEEAVKTELYRVMSESEKPTKEDRRIMTGKLPDPCSASSHLRESFFPFNVRQSSIAEHIFVL
jgi:hypothetical protein